jgi:hypothetical protein
MLQKKGKDEKAGMNIDIFTEEISTLTSFEKQKTLEPKKLPPKRKSEDIEKDGIKIPSSVKRYLISATIIICNDTRIESSSIKSTKRPKNTTTISTTSGTSFHSLVKRFLREEALVISFVFLFFLFFLLILCFRETYSNKEIGSR